MYHLLRHQYDWPIVNRPVAHGRTYRDSRTAFCRRSTPHGLLHSCLMLAYCSHNTRHILKQGPDSTTVVMLASHLLRHRCANIPRTIHRQYTRRTAQLQSAGHIHVQSTLQPHVTTRSHQHPHHTSHNRRHLSSTTSTDNPAIPHRQSHTIIQRPAV